MKVQRSLHMHALIREKPQTLNYLQERQEPSFRKPVSAGLTLWKLAGGRTTHKELDRSATLLLYSRLFFGKKRLDMTDILLTGP